MAAARFSALALLAGAVTQPAWAAGVFNVLDYGAKGDGTTLDTSAVRATLQAAAQAHGGEVVFPWGYTFLTRPFNLSSNVQLSVEGTVMFSDDPSDDWPLIPQFAWFGPTTSPQFQPLIMAWEDANNITITGARTCAGSLKKRVHWGNLNCVIKCASLVKKEKLPTTPCRLAAGGGTIDGNGTKWWPCAVDPAVPPCYGVPRPPALLFTYKGSG